MHQSLCGRFQDQVVKNATQVAVRRADGTAAMTWQQYGDRVRELAAGFAGLGIARGDTLGIMLTNRPEFHVVDAAAMHLGATTFSVYNTSTVEQIAYIFSNASPTVVVTETQFLPRVLDACAGNSVKYVVTIDGDVHDGHTTMSLADVVGSGDPAFDFEAAWRAVTADDVLTLIYTSGTTGNPKGVELTHANLMYQLGMATELVGELENGRVLSYLPDAHLINRWICQYAPMYFALTVTDVHNPKTLVDTLAQNQPTLFAAVPMVWYKIKGAVETKIGAERGPRGALARWALAAGRTKAAATIAERPLARTDALKAAVADRLVLSKIRTTLGLQDLVAAVSGASAIDVAALEFMLALGIPVLEAWGMSETSAITTLNPAGEPRFGTVGRAVPGTEVVLADDGEVLVRGRGVMRGYRNDPERTADVLDPDGWIHTGDVGVFDADGYLRIVDRKKELIINSGGKNMSPSNIEGALKAASPLIGTVVAIGNDRPHVAALVTLDPDACAAFAAGHRIATADDAPSPELLASAALRDALEAAVAVANSRLSRVEQIRSWQVLPCYWHPGGDELTPTMKLKRAPINTKYAAQIDALYSK